MTYRRNLASLFALACLAGAYLGPVGASSSPDDPPSAAMQPESDAKAPPAISPQTDDAALRAAIAQRFGAGIAWAASSVASEALTEVRAAYAESGHAPMWIGPDGVSARARELTQGIAALRHDGLDPQNYGLEVIERLVGHADTTDDLAALEVQLSVALVQAASDLASGRLEPRRVNPKLYIYPQDVDKTEVLEKARGEDEIAAYLQDFQPGQANYHRLKAALSDYRDMAANLQWPPISPGQTLELGMAEPRVAQLRERLRALEDIPLGTPVADESQRFDAVVEAGVKRFQSRHGLAVDGKVGKNTLRALNVPLTDRVRQMLLNMERRRWMPDHFEDRYVFVNLADFFLKVVEKIDGRERTIHTTEVVVGKPYHQTPEFSHQIRYLVINPYWNVPPSIARNELLPKFKREPSYLLERGYELLDGWSRQASLVDPDTIDWENVTWGEFRYKIRQRPGPYNALGRIKFMFPNPHNIYLHDTPARTLFARTQRAFSHGCIRVKNPDALAATLLRWQHGWPAARVRRTIDEGARTVVSLAQPVPVHLAYITAWVNKDGTVHFRDDIYKRDRSLAAALLPAAGTNAQTIRASTNANRRT